MPILGALAQVGRVASFWLRKLAVVPVTGVAMDEEDEAASQPAPANMETPAERLRRQLAVKSARRGEVRGAGGEQVREGGDRRFTWSGPAAVVTPTGGFQQKLQPSYQLGILQGLHPRAAGEHGVRAGGVSAGEVRGAGEVRAGEVRGGAESRPTGGEGTKPAGKVDEIVDKVRYKPLAP